MGLPIPDLIGTAVTLGGLPTITMPAQSYGRKITRALVKNTVSSTCNIYVGSLTSQARMSTDAGSNNTFDGGVYWPPGQPLFIQWTASGSPVSGATARISLERVDNPLVESFDGGRWSTTSITSFAVPTIGPQQLVLVGGSDIPAELRVFYPTISTALIGYTQRNPDAYVYFAWSGSGTLPVLSCGTFNTTTIKELYSVANDPNPTMTFPLTGALSSFGDVDFGNAQDIVFPFADVRSSFSGPPLYFLTSVNFAPANANLVLATGAPVAASGCSFVLASKCLWVALIFADVQYTAAGATVAIAELFQDGANPSGATANFSAGDAVSTPRGMSVQIYSGTFSPTLGTPTSTLELRGSKSAAAATVRFASGNTQLVVLLFA